MKNCYVYDLNGYIEYYTHFSQIFELCSTKNSKEMLPKFEKLSKTRLGFLFQKI